MVPADWLTLWCRLVPFAVHAAVIYAAALVARVFTSALWIPAKRHSGFPRPELRTPRLPVLSFRLGECDVAGTEVLFKMRQLCRAGDGNNERLFVHQPGQGCLGGCDSPCAAESVKRFYNPGIGADGIRLEA